MLAKAVILAFASLLASAAAEGSKCSTWSPSPYEKHANHSLSGPGNAIRKARCLYGQEAANGECEESGKRDKGPASQECVCMSKEAARDAAESHQALSQRATALAPRGRQARRPNTAHPRLPSLSSVRRRSK